jgi:hypothetical protein
MKLPDPLTMLLTVWALYLLADGIVCAVDVWKILWPRD